MNTKKISKKGMSIIAIVFLLLIVPSVVQAATYYIDSVAGVDSNNGISTSTPWKTLSKVTTYSSSPGFQPGDNILFKRGSVWSEELYFRSSGNTNSKITLGAYGTGSLPLFTGRSELTGWNSASSWTEVSPNIWLYPTTQHIKRLRLNNVEYEFTKAYNNITATKRWSYDFNTFSNLYIYSTGNPATAYNNISVISDSSFPAILYIQNVEDLIIENLNISGGFYESTYIANANNLILRNMAIGYDSYMGLQCKGSDSPNYLMSSNNIIDNVSIDSGYRVSNTEDYGNLEDGVNLDCGCNYWTIKNSLFIDWGHSALYPICQSTNYAIGASYNNFINNYFDDTHLTYGRAYNVDGYEGMASYNNFTNNTIRNTWSTNQMNGDHNTFAYNIVDTMINSLRKPDVDTAIGLQIVVYGNNLVAHDNIVDHNTFVNLEGPGVQIQWYAVGPTYNNIVSNNIFINNGKVGKSDNEANISMFVYNNAQVYNNLFKNNVVYQSNNNQWVARYRDTNMNSAAFVTSSLSYGDSASNTKWMNPQLDTNYVPKNSEICTFQDGVSFVGARPCSNQPSPPVNTPPTISASLSSSLNCSTSTYDADGDPLSVSIQWYVNGSLIRTVNKTSDKLANATGIYYCKAQAYDGKDYSSWATSNTVTIASLTHLPPLATVALTSTDSTTNSDLNCDYTVSGRNNVTINTRLLWYKNSVLAISNGQSTLGKGNLTIGDVWYCQVNVSDIYNTTIANSNSLTILASPNPAATITYINLSGNISKLNCSGKYSDNNATLSATIKFIKDNVLMNTSTITASNNTFFSATQVGAVGTWKCNISVETTTSTSNSIIITQTYHPPSINVTLTNISNNLSCNYNVADAGSDATAVVKWYKNNSLFTTGPTTITNASAGSWYCQITATDTYNTTLANSNTITITLPIYLAPLVSIALTSADSTINSDLNCVNTITGRNSVAVNSKISWYKNNALIISNGQQILGKSNLTVGDVWYCKINATDAYNTTIVNSNTITISDVAQAPIVIPPSNSGGSSGSSYYPITDTTTTVDNTSNSSESITIPSTTSTTPSTIESPSNIDSQVNTSDNSTLSNNVNDVKTKPNMEQPKNIKKNLSVNAVANNVVPYIMVTIFITSLSLLIFSKKRVAATAKIVPNILSPLKIKIAPSIISNVKAAYNLKDKILQYIDSGKVTAETLTRLIRGYANNGMLTPVEVRELHTHLRR